MILHTLRNTWPLFSGLGIIGLCIGAQNTLLGLRAELEGFDTHITGIVMSTYFAGFLLGSLRAPHIIKRVGHVRTFAALTALASISILIHALIVTPWVWMIMRLLTGFAISAIYVVAESWLNQAADNRIRGRILSLYMITMLAGISCGQFLINVADPLSFVLFSLISVLISLAAIPVLVTSTPMPPFKLIKPVNIALLYRSAPTGLFGSIFINTAYAVIFGMGAVYAKRMGMSISQVSFFMAAMVLGGILFQWPLGRLSDRVDRRIIIAVAATGSCLFALASAYAGVTENGLYLALALLFGGCCFPLLALYLAVTNDELDADQASGASSTLLLVGGIGSVLGPLLASVAMERWGPSYYFWMLALFSGLMAAHALYRISAEPQPTTGEHSVFQIQAPTPVGSVLLDAEQSDAKENGGNN